MVSTYLARTCKPWLRFHRDTWRVNVQFNKYTHTDAVRETGERRVESETNVEKKGLVQ